MGDCKRHSGSDDAKPQTIVDPKVGNADVVAAYEAVGQNNLDGDDDETGDHEPDEIESEKQEEPCQNHEEYLVDDLQDRGDVDALISSQQAVERGHDGLQKVGGREDGDADNDIGRIIGCILDKGCPYFFLLHLTIKFFINLSLFWVFFIE